MRPTINVYIDGFNLYYGLVKRAKQKHVAAPEFRWLNLAKLSQFLLQDHRVARIHYFTAIVKVRDDPGNVVRQQTFLRALRTLPGLSIEYGYFQENEVRLRRKDPCTTCGKSFVEVLKSEEKGSDVNLASRLLIDAYEGKCKAAAVISNDSDLALPIAKAAELLPRGVIVFNPHPGKTARRLRDVATTYRTIKEKTLRASVFPDQLRDAAGLITKPPAW